MSLGASVGGSWVPLGQLWGALDAIAGLSARDLRASWWLWVRSWDTLVALGSLLGHRGPVRNFGIISGPESSNGNMGTDIIYI